LVRVAKRIRGCGDGGDGCVEAGAVCDVEAAAGSTVEDAEVAGHGCSLIGKFAMDIIRGLDSCSNMICFPIDRIVAVLIEYIESTIAVT
jgi:hypothetical protein